MKKALKYLKSLKLSLVLMIVLPFIIAAGNLIPQVGRKSPDGILEWQEKYSYLAGFVKWAGLHHLYTTWWFLLIFAVLCLNMSLVTWDLFKRTRRKAKGLHRFTGEAPEYYSLGKYPFNDKMLDGLGAVLKKRRYTIAKKDDEIYARKGWFGIWGGTVLHVGFVVIFAGAVLSSLTRFNGYTEAGIGQGFKEAASSYIEKSQGLLFPGHREDLTIVFEDIKEIKTEKFLQVRSTVVILKNGNPVASKTIWMNEPLYYKGLKVFQSRIFGPAFLFRKDGLSGAETGYVNLKTYGRKKAGANFSIPGADFQARVDYDPKIDKAEFELRQKEKLLFKGPLNAGDSFSIGPDTLTFDAMKKWAGVIVVYDWAVPVIFLGFAFCVIGIAVMGIFDPREIWIKKLGNDGGERIEILGWGRWRNMFLEEFNEMLKETEAWMS